MDKNTLESSIATLESALKKYEEKAFNVYFFVMDTKGNPSATLRYIYQTAYTLKELGYNVTMLHQEKDFVGVGDWLGEKYANLPHKNVESTNVEVAACDFLFIPEIYANVMSQTKNLRCKRVAILTNMNYLTEIIPVGVTWFDLGIDEAVTTCNSNAEAVTDYFPGLKTHVVSPYIPNMFRPSNKPQDLMVNFISRDPSDINKVIKPFFWKYPIYKWVSFRDVRGLPQETFAEALREVAFTIWMDDDTNFGTSLLEAVNSGNIVLAKVPKVLSDWMVDKDGNLTNAVIWFDDVRKLPDVIASAVRTWLIDEIPQEVYDNAKEVQGLFTYDRHKKEVIDCYENHLFSARKAELVEAIAAFKAELNNNQLVEELDSTEEKSNNE